MSETLETLDPPGTAPDGKAVDDLSALSWVHGELRRTLETAHKSLRRHLKEAEAAAGSDLATIDPAVLRTARVHLHQGVGALEMVALPQAAAVLKASEAAVQRMIARPAMVDSAAVETIEKASFALLDFLARKLARKDVSPVMLFPQYRAAQLLAGAERVHPADLWPVPWQWHELPRDPRAQPRQVNDTTRSAMESAVLGVVRLAPGDTGHDTLMVMSDLCADLGAGALESSFGGPRMATLWQLAAAVFEAQAKGLLQPDSYSKRLASGMLAQVRQRIRGPVEAPERLAQDLLFFCSHAQAPAQPFDAPRLSVVRQVWKLQGLPTADYEQARLGRHDPAVLTLARKRLGLARDAWSAVAGGELHRLAGLSDLFQLMGESLQRLLPEGDTLAQALQAAVTQTTASGAEPAPALAMEVATAVLYVDASIEDAQFDHPELAQRVAHLARRIDDVRIGADPQPLEVWMEELYRRVSDRQTMGSVVQELRASLSEIEKQIDQYFRDPARRELLIPVPAQLSAMRGVLSVLGMVQASQAALHMRDDVEALAQTEVDPQQAVRAGTFNRLADNLGALSFLIDMLSVQPQLTKSLFRFDPDTGSLSAVMGQTGRVSAFAAFDDGDSSAPLKLDLRKTVQPLPPPPPPAPAAVDMSRFVSETTIALRPAKTPAAVEPPAPMAPPPPLPPQVPNTDTGLEDDAEMREIFIEEAREVIAQAQAALERLADAPDSTADLTTVRRAFHTLKGSARMLGLREFGEAAWACEQLYNDRLASAPRMDGALRGLTVDALDYLAGWTSSIEQQQPQGHRAADVAQAADSLRLRGERLPVAAPRLQPAEAPALPALPVLDMPLAPEPAAAAASAFEATIPLPPLPVEADPEPAPVAPVAPADSGLITLDFDLQEDAPPPLEDLEPLPLIDADATLASRVPGLPTAADLDLGELTIAQAPPPAPLTFDLDLNDLENIDETATVPLPTPSLQPQQDESSLLNLPLEPVAASASPEVPAAAEVPAMPAIPEGEVLEIGIADLDLPLDLDQPQPAVEAAAPLPPEPQPLAELPAAPTLPETEPPASEAEAEDEQVKVIGPLRISIPLFNIFLNEADEKSRALCTELAEWALEWERHPVADSTAALAHSLAGSSATVGYSELSALARALEHALLRSHAHGRGRPGEATLFTDAAEDIRRLLHQFAAGFLRPVAPELMERLAEHERLPVESSVLTPAEVATGAAQPEAAADAAVEAVDAIDDELFPIFEEEADELLPQLQTRLREWLDDPAEADAAMACMRTLHTLKGGARLAGAMRIGEMAHGLETAIEALGDRGQAQPAEIEALLAQADAMSTAFDALRQRGAAPAPAAPAIAAAQPTAAVPVLEQASSVTVAELPAAELPVRRPPQTRTLLKPQPQPVLQPSAIDWSRFAASPADAAATAAAGDRPSAVGAGAVVRVRAGLLDRLVNQAGEVSITRARIGADVKALQASLGDLSESMERMRRQLRDIEVQAETQITSRIEAAKAAAQAFDPLEMDRFTRFQELTRFMAESVNDVATLQRSLQRTLQSTEDELAAQGRLTRELQDDLLRTRMIEFDSISERLYRVARQAAKETGKQVKVDIVGGAIEVDRGVLERMAGPFEHLLRNSVAHGVEKPEGRQAAGKDATGTITITVAQAGNEVGVEIADDGGGLDLARIRQRGVERGLLAADAQASDEELAGLIFAPGFSTAESVTELAGRGVGLDVVRAEVNALGGRVETQSEPGRGTRFKLLLPLTTAVTQVVMLRCGELQVAVPSPLIEIVRRVPSDSVDRSYANGLFEYAGEQVPFFWLPALLRLVARGDTIGRTQTVVIVRSASQRVAVHVDEVVGNQEVVVKNVGPQLSRLPGLAGVTLLPSGVVALIYNPVALAALYGDEARLRQRQLAPSLPDGAAAAQAARAPLVMVVDDSLTVRRVTQRLLTREGYRVRLAKDGIDALDQLADELPVVMLSDIEMPRMDGFDLVRNVRSDPRLSRLPVVMITSRIAQKHREYAAELGVQHYLGKPYSEEELLILVSRYAAAATAG